MSQTITEVNHARLLKRCERSHIKAKSGSLGHARFGLNIAHALRPNRTLVIANISNLCLVILTSTGNVENRLADTAPKPKVTKSIGSAQQLSLIHISEPTRPY